MLALGHSARVWMGAGALQVARIHCLKPGLFLRERAIENQEQAQKHLGGDRRAEGRKEGVAASRAEMEPRAGERGGGGKDQQLRR